MSNINDIAENMFYRILETDEEQAEYTKDDKFYILDSCKEFIPAKGKTISDYGFVDLLSEEEAIKHFGLQKL